MTALSRCLTAVLLMFAANAHAGTVCVNSVSGLVQAVNSYDLLGDGDTLTIKIVQGSYLVGSQLFATPHDAGENNVGLKLLGGYSAGCTSRTINPSNTIIDANNQANTALWFYIGEEVNALVEGITFTRFSPPTGGSALELLSYHGFGDQEIYAVRHCRFVRNSARRVVSMEAAQLDFSNNLVADNTLIGGGAAAVVATYKYQGNTRVALNNNTVANNSGGAGVVITTDTRESARITEISDNVLWGNSNIDLNLTLFDISQNPTPLLSSNLVGTSAGLALPAGNISANPQFVNAAAGNYALSPGSPGINSGAPLQFYGFPSRDLLGGSRIVGNSIDRGAFEATVDNQTTFLVTTAGDNGSNASPIVGSLRAAIKAANASSLPFKINFAISGACPRIVSLAAPMLDITGDVTIDGTTQPGWIENSSCGKFDATLCLVVNGVGNTPYAFHVPPGASNARLVVRGIMYAGFTDAALKIEGGANHRISGNQFGAVPFTSANNDAIRITGNSGGAYIGGFDDTGAVNLIAGSTDAGIYLDNASGGSTLGNNVIGFQVDGETNGPNNIGVFIFNSPSNNLLYNSIGYNSSNGVTISGAASSGTLLQNNVIGITGSGANAGNVGSGVGVLFAANNSTIGAPISGSYGANRISNNGGAGVWISPSGGAGNRVLVNQINNNGGVDIDLGSAGASANQASNPVSGPNHLQNYPQLSSALLNSANPSVLINGSLHSAPNGSYRIDVYYDIACDTSAPTRGSARRWLGRDSILTNANGDSSFSISVPSAAGLPIGVVSATATNSAGDTSEVGNCVGEVSGSLPDLMFHNGFE